VPLLPASYVDLECAEILEKLDGYCLKESIRIFPIKLNWAKGVVWWFGLLGFGLGFGLGYPIRGPQTTKRPKPPINAWKFNSSPLKISPSQKEGGFPTISFQGRAGSTSGGVTIT